MLLPGPVYIARGPGHFEDFRKTFQPNIGEDPQKKSQVHPALVMGLRL